MIFEEFLKEKGIIKCINSKNQVYYLDIEEHTIYTEEELKKVFEGK